LFVPFRVQPWEVITLSISAMICASVRHSARPLYGVQPLAGNGLVSMKEPPTVELYWIPEYWVVTA
jgi:hypothetical protein